MKVIQNKHLVLSLNQQNYAIPLCLVREVLYSVNVTPVESDIPSIKGVIRIRGQVVPVLELCGIFGIKSYHPQANSTLIIIDASREEKPFIFGVEVDDVCDVTDLEEVLPQSRALKKNNHHPYLSGISKYKKEILMVLDVAKLFLAEIPKCTLKPAPIAAIHAA